MVGRRFCAFGGRQRDQRVNGLRMAGQPKRSCRRGQCARRLCFDCIGWQCICTSHWRHQTSHPSVIRLGCIGQRASRRCVGTRCVCRSCLLGAGGCAAAGRVPRQHGRVRPACAQRSSAHGMESQSAAACHRQASAADGGQASARCHHLGRFGNTAGSPANFCASASSGAQPTPGGIDPLTTSSPDEDHQPCLILHPLKRLLLLLLKHLLRPPQALRLLPHPLHHLLPFLQAAQRQQRAQRRHRRQQRKARTHGCQRSTACSAPTAPRSTSKPARAK